MLTPFAHAFRTPDLRKKLLFTLGILALFRLGSTIPAPAVDYQQVHACLSLRQNSSVLQLVNLFSGGALQQLTIFALGIVPCITSSIIIQLLVIVSPRLGRLKEQGQAGQARLTQYTRYLTLALALIQSNGIVALARFLPGSYQSFPFGGTSVLILVGVGLNTSKHIESQLMLRNYEGFLR